MSILITRTALESYLALLSEGLLTRALYREIIRPDLLQLRNRAQEQRFRDPRFWCPACSHEGGPIQGAHIMTWYQLGPSRIQLRLDVLLPNPEHPRPEIVAWLGRAHVWSGRQQESKESERLLTWIQAVREGREPLRGGL